MKQRKFSEEEIRKLWIASRRAGSRMTLAEFKEFYPENLKQLSEIYEAYQVDKRAGMRFSFADYAKVKLSLKK